MNIPRPTWLNFIILSLCSIFIWLALSYPQLAFNHFTVDRAQAINIAQDFIKKSRGEDPARFQTAVIFEEDDRTNRYLQKTIGFDKLKAFIKMHDFDMFFWIIRFYKENQKEEYRLTVSASNGEVTSFRHVIDDAAPRSEIERDEARRRVIQFLKDRFKFNPDEYSVKGDLKNQFDHRIEYSFSWFKKSVSIPWSQKETSGTGKLITGATISGDEILSFAKNYFDIPDEFNRYMDRIRNVGQNISAVVRVVYYILITAAIFFIVVRRDHLVMQSTKRFYLYLVAAFFILALAGEANLFQEILFGYRTTQPFDSYLWRYIVDAATGILFFTVTIFVPGLAGELLHYEVSKEGKKGSFLPFVLSTFLSRSVAQSVFLGYLVCMIMMGMQSLLIRFGQQFLGVWVEYNWIGHLSTAYLPFLAAFTIGFQASLNEEILYRLFAINWGKKIFKSTLAAAVVASLIWGFAHTNYPVYPSWFRGLEVTCLGFFLSYVYLRFGLIPVLVGHYLFDVFWNSAAYLLGQTNPLYFFSSLSVLLLPLLFGFIAYAVNKPEKPLEMHWHLNKHQLYNLGILKLYLDKNQDNFLQMSKEKLREEIISHGWDVAVVDLALDSIYDNKSNQ